MSAAPSLTTGRDPARLFFALWPDDDVRARLAALTGRLHAPRGGHRMRPENLHLTLVFLGEVPRARLPELLAVGAAVAGEGFLLDLDRIDCWRHNRVAFAAPSAPPQALLALVAALERDLTRAGFDFDRRAYKPHVTLLRQADCAETDTAPEPVSWLARDFVLVESTPRGPGSGYDRLARFPLGGG